MPGGIKLCSPGTFLVANYLIINNSSFQVNFMKPNWATIRYTNSQRLREDATEVSVGRVAVPKVRYKTISPREDPPEVPVGKVAVPKSCQSSPSPRPDASEAPVGKVAVPKTSQKSPFATRGCLWIICGPTLRADGYAEHPIRTSMSIKQPDSMDTHPIRTSTDR